MDVAFDGGQDDGRLSPLVDLLHPRLEIGDGRLHGLGRLEDEGKLHLSGPEELTHRLHAGQEEIVDDGQRSVTARECLFQIVFEAVAFSVDDPVLESALDGPVRAVLGHDGAGRDALEDGEQLPQRVISLGPAVVDEIEADLPSPFVDLRQREDPCRVDDGGIEARLDAFVEEHGIENVPGGRVESERDIGQAHDGEDAGELGLDTPDPFEGLDAVAAGLLHARREGEDEGIEDEVRRLEAVAADGDLVDGLGRSELPVRRAGLTLGIDAGADDGGPVLPGEREETVEAGPGIVALLEVYRVEDGAPTDPAQRRFDDGSLGRVHHERDAGLGGEAADDLVHVRDAVGPRVVDADIEDVGAFFDLVTSNDHRRIPVGGQHGVAELLGAVGVGALTDDQKRRVLVERDGTVDGGGSGLVLGTARGRGEVPTALHHSPEMIGGGAAAAADDSDAEFGDEALEVIGQAFGGEVVVHGPVDHGGEPGVRLDGDGGAAVLRKVADGFAHLGRAGGAIESDDVGSHGFEGGESSTDFGSRQHPARELDGHLDLERDAATGGHHGAAAGVQCRLGLQEVEDGFDDQDVDPAGEKCRRLLLVGVAQGLVGDLAQGGEFRARPEVAGHPAGMVGGGGPVDRLAGDPCRGQVDLGHPVLQCVFGQDDPEGAEGIGLDHVDPDVEEGLVDGRHLVGARQDEGLVAALELGAAEVLGTELRQLQGGAHGAVEDDDPMGGGVEVGGAPFIEGQGVEGQNRRELMIVGHGGTSLGGRADTAGSMRIRGQDLHA